MKSTPFLLFDGECAEAMTFYQHCFGGELSLMAVGETPMKAGFPPEKHDRIINARLVSGAVDITASDWMASPDLDPVVGNTTAVYITGESLDELSAPFEALKAGGNTTHLQELGQVPFGIYGQLFDRYGVQWIFVGERPTP